MKTFVSVFLVLLLAAGIARSQADGSSVTNLIMSSYSARMFTSDPVPDSQLNVILKCGIKAPSARNIQPWKFTVVRDTALNASIIRDITPGNVLVFVSGQETGQPGMNIDFDCALAAENMYIAAISLGLGAHIYTGPVLSIDDAKKQELEIPEGYRVVTILRIGSIDNSVDAVSSASARKSLEEVVNYK